MTIIDAFRSHIGLILAGIFWLIVLIQFLIRWREKQQIKKNTTCPACGGKDLQVEIATMAYDLDLIRKGKGFFKIKRSQGMNKVSLVKNIGGGILSLSLAVVVLSQFFILASDLLMGSNATGIQKETLKMKIAFPSAMLVVGIPLLIIGLTLILMYVAQKKKQISLTCNQCRSVFGMDGVVLSQSEVENSLAGRQEVESSPPGVLKAESASLASSQGSQAASESMEPCQKCGSLIEASDLTCPHCGHTQWGVIGVMAVVSLLMIGFVVYRILKGTGSGFFFWGGAALGALVLAATIYSVIQALQKPG